MRILVTGGAGFIGSNVADRLIALGHEVAIFDDLSSGFREFVNPSARLFIGDLADANAVERCVSEFRPEIVDHHAAQIDVRKSVSDPVFDARVNVLGTLGLLQSCSRNGVRKLVYASTGGALYGEGRQLPATEDHPINPEAPYGASKHTVEHYLYIWKLLHGLDYTVLRYPNVYGPRQNPHGEAGVNAIFIGLMLEGRRPRIFGTGEQVRDYLYVDDVVAANVLALAQASGEIMNIGTGVGTSVLDIVREINRILGTTIEPQFEDARAGEIQRIYLDAAHARSVMGWTPQVSFGEGLRRTVEWSRVHPLPIRPAAGG
ncbi:MAG: NAD-dependent epimerase/dehydratase family protein [Candidatus Eisenbacteria bacterium]|uniref:NAD-dependent epimerase/dehydratase family protein n=1 Tax=Eiseniibacteriota bacterium TaxID=2212470 RepID=A0A849STV2_UNCEI|nr:NAD-dependent epimerase/dehydratase family protein [Candidatus Eisenbacteria bacterium]